jgi:hypothetical protein
MTWRFLALCLVAIAGCSNSEPGKCGCTVDVPEGHLDIDCGVSKCLAGAGYLCVGPGMVSAFPAACSLPTADLGACTPSCFGRTCGDDGCGGSCGLCAAGKSCLGGNCVGGPCTASCAGKQCGPDGCGGSCGACSFGQTCSAAGRCSCTPSCSAGSCGSDGCGGTCACPTGFSCNGGTCCSNLNGPCQTSANCCNGAMCDQGTCRAIDHNTCHGYNDTCTSPYDCCSGRCSSGKCGCGAMGAYCRPGQNSDCCSLSCGLVFGCN